MKTKTELKTLDKLESLAREIAATTGISITEARTLVRFSLAAAATVVGVPEAQINTYLNRF